MNPILYGLICFEFMKVMQCESTKEMWDKFQTIYERDEKIKEAKLHTYRAQFEGLKMKEYENVATYFLIVVEVVKSIKGLGEDLEDSIVVKKVVRSPLERYNPKALALEESRVLKTLKIDELQEILIAYEMRK